MTQATPGFTQYKVEEYYVHDEPFYIPQSDEIALFTAAYNEQIPVLLKGPTGTGKTRFIEHMAWRLSTGVNGAHPKHGSENGIPLVTVACHEDLTASDLVGRYLIDRDGTRWIDGPLTLAVKAGGICYLDEIVEARKDTTVIIHSLTDHRRMLTIDNADDDRIVQRKSILNLIVKHAIRLVGRQHVFRVGVDANLRHHGTQRDSQHCNEYIHQPRSLGRQADNSLFH